MLVFYQIQAAASLLLESKMFYVPFVLNSASIRQQMVERGLMEPPDLEIEIPSQPASLQPQPPPYQHHPTQILQDRLQRPPESSKPVTVVVFNTVLPDHQKTEEVYTENSRAFCVFAGIFGTRLVIIVKCVFNMAVFGHQKTARCATIKNVDT